MLPSMGLKRVGHSLATEGPQMKEFKLGVFFPRKRVMTRDKFYLSGPINMTGQISHY